MAIKKELVYIEWIDSVATVPTWMSEEDALEWGNDTENFTIKQVGFVLKKTKNILLLVSRISPEQVGGVFKIPLKCITKMTSLKV
jgi:hypothetical protein